MACETIVRIGQTREQRKTEVKKALERLEAALKTGQASVVIGANGAVAFKGWQGTNRNDVTDACAYRTLSSQNSWALRQAVARAEATSGRKVNPQTVKAGVHSHDGGKTWDKGH